MATQSDLVTKSAEGALKEIEKYAPDQYAKLEADPAKKEEILQAARESARETLSIAEEFPEGVNDDLQDISERIAKHLSQDRITLLQGGLNIPTFRMKIIRNDDGKDFLEFRTRDGKEYQPIRELASRQDADWGIIEQYASIIVEAILFALSVIGSPLSPSPSVIKKTISATAEVIRKSWRLQKAIADFVVSWGAAESNPVKMATALFFLIKDSFLDGILWTIIEGLCTNMNWFDWLKTAAKVSAMIIAAIATGGAALIAEIAVIVMAAADFVAKIINVMQLSVIMRTL